MTCPTFPSFQRTFTPIPRQIPFDFRQPVIPDFSLTSELGTRHSKFEAMEFETRNGPTAVVLVPGSMVEWLHTMTLHIYIYINRASTVHSSQVQTNRL